MRRSPISRFATLVFLLSTLPLLAADRENDSALLQRTTRQIGEYLELISDVRCTEHVSQIKFDNRGGTQYREEATYDYFVLMQGSNDQFLLNESRLPLSQRGRIPQRVSMLASNGFSDLFLILHPYYRDSFDFDGGQEQVVEGQKLAVFQFRHIPASRSPVALSVRGREFPLELAGRVYVDPDTGMITRIDAELTQPMPEVGLRSLKVQVTYEPVQLPGWNRMYRFPAQASIEVESLRQHWRNVHRFTSYQRFTVDTEVSVKAGDRKKEGQK